MSLHYDNMINVLKLHIHCISAGVPVDPQCHNMQSPLCTSTVEAHVVPAQCQNTPQVRLPPDQLKGER